MPEPVRATRTCAFVLLARKRAGTWLSRRQSQARIERRIGRVSTSRYEQRNAAVALFDPRVLRGGRLPEGADVRMSGDTLRIGAVEVAATTHPQAATGLFACP